MRYLLHDVFSKTVKQMPQKNAVFIEGGKTISYQELNSLANRFANYFKSKKTDIRKKPYVGVLSAVHIESIAAVLGTLKIGGTYVPLDEYSPDERLLAIINNTKMDTIVIDPVWYGKHKGILEAKSVENVILLQPSDINDPKITPFSTIEAESFDEPPFLNQVCDDLAYILHSSGSTGVPKGIMLSHRNARTFVDWMHEEFKVSSDDVIMSRAPFKFDLSVFDIFNTFNAGATLVCFDWNRERDSEQKHSDYVRLMEETKATILYTTPSTFIVMLNRGGLAQADLKLREIMYAGEPFPVPQLKRLQEALPNTRIANIYGPTETNIITYWWVDKLSDDIKDIPLGYEVEDTEIIVVSEDKTHICETNELGELWCRGGTVTWGYLGMAEKTAECLVESPFHPYPAKFWRTGDFGFRDEDGILHYRGRKDHMVKVKGFRIELGEIESALAKHPLLDEFCVVAVPDEKYGNRLYCYYSILTNKIVGADDIKNFLLTKIPEYMVPYLFIKKDVMPKTSSGKVDRVLLAQEAAQSK